MDLSYLDGADFSEFIQSAAEEFAPGGGAAAARGASSEGGAACLFPRRYDMRDYGFLTPVRNQSALGVCWAFSSCASMESNLLKKGRGEYDLSEWQLGYQSRQDVSPDKPSFSVNPDPLLPGDWNDGIEVSSGNNAMTTAFLARGTGPVFESEAPYPCGESSMLMPLYRPSDFTPKLRLRRAAELTFAQPELIKAAVVKEHPDWLLRDEKGKLVIGGFAWNGFYVLDHEKAEVREYVKKVFDTAIDEWNYDMFKLDFLYAACIIPRGGKSRGRLMHEAMTFLRECVRDKLLLGCGVPMTSSFGFVDACRTGCDAELSFADKFYVKCTNNEIISTKHSIIDTVFRRHLNGRIFLSDPDVFFLRDAGMKRTDYTQSQKELLAKVNKMCGSVLFVSDNAGDYDAKRRAMLLDAFAPLDGRITEAEMDGSKIHIGFCEKGVEKSFDFDLSTGDYTVRALK